MENQHFGQWGIALIMITFFVWFIFKYAAPRKKREWRNSGVLSGFLIALYAEMYGFPLTVYILTSIFGVDIPLGDIEGRHLWAWLFNLGATGALVEMTIALVILFIGMSLVVAGWKKVYFAKNSLVTDGIYDYMRHPQYTGILLITFSMIIHWPTFITLILFPVIVIMYYSLAKKEEKEMVAKFGQDYQIYKNKVPMFIPKISFR